MPVKVSDVLPSAAPGLMSPVDPADEPAYELFDFTRPSVLTVAQAARIDETLQALSSAWATTLTATLRTVCTVSVLTGELRDRLDVIAETPSDHTLVEWTLPGERATGFLALPATAALSFAARMLGSTRASQVVPRRLTEIERALLGRLSAPMLDDVPFAFDSLVTGPAALRGYPTHDQMLASAAAEERVLWGGFVVSLEDQVVPVGLAIPASAVLPNLGHGEIPQDRDEVELLIAEHVAEIDVEVAVAFPEFSVDAGTVLNLAPGDIVPLGHAAHRPLEVSLDGVPVATASLGSDGEFLACVVVERMEKS